MTPPVSACRDDNDRIEPRERVEAVEPELRLPGRLFTGVRDVAVLQIFAEQQSVLLQRPRDRQPRLELVDEREPFAETGHEVVGLDHPLVGAALGANLRHARRESAVLGGKRIRQHLDRFDGAARQLEIEVAGRRIVQAGAAHLKRAGRRARRL